MDLESRLEDMKTPDVCAERATFLALFFVSLPSFFFYCLDRHRTGVRVNLVLMKIFIQISFARTNSKEITTTVLATVCIQFFVCTKRQIANVYARECDVSNGESASQFRMLYVYVEPLPGRLLYCFEVQHPGLNALCKLVVFLFFIVKIFSLAHERSKFPQIFIITTYWKACRKNALKNRIFWTNEISGHKINSVPLVK